MQYPHCDSSILHGPGECEYCDRHPEWQALRVTWGINFTGHYEPNLQPCPAETRRTLATINKWGGNTPQPVVDAIATNPCKEIVLGKIEIPRGRPWVNSDDEDLG